MVNLDWVGFDPIVNKTVNLIRIGLIEYRLTRTTEYSINYILHRKGISYK